MFFRKKEKETRTIWMINDGTCMPIACSDKETAEKIVKKEFDNETWRIWENTVEINKKGR